MTNFIYADDSKEWSDYLDRNEMPDPATIAFPHRTHVRMNHLWGYGPDGMTDTIYDIEVKVEAGTTLKEAIDMIWARYAKAMEAHGAVPRELFYEGYRQDDSKVFNHVEVIWGS